MTGPEEDKKIPGPASVGELSALVPTARPEQNPQEATMPPMRQERFETGCLVTLNHGSPLVVLSYFDDIRGDPKVVLGKPGCTPEFSVYPIRILLCATKEVPETYPVEFKHLIVKHHLQDKVIAAFRELKKLQELGESNVPIPVGATLPALRLRLFRAIIPKVMEFAKVEGSVPPFAVTGVEDSTIQRLVAAFFEKKERPPKITTIEPESPKHQAVAVAELRPGASSFSDRSKPITAVGPTGEEMQLVAKRFVWDRLNARLKPGEPLITKAEVTGWIRKHLTPVSTQVNEVTEGRAVAGSPWVQAYSLTEVLETIDRHPVRSKEPHLATDGRGTVAIGEYQVEVIGVHALGRDKTAPSGAISSFLKKMGVTPIPGIKMKPADSGMARSVFAAKDVDRFVTYTFWNSQGLELPTGDTATPGIRVCLLTDRISRHEKPHLVEESLASRGIKPVKLKDLGLATKIIPVGGGRDVLFHEVEIPGQAQKRVLMTTYSGEVLVQCGEHHSDTSRVYRDKELEEGLAKLGG